MTDAETIALLEAALNDIAAWGDDLAHADEPASARRARAALAQVRPDVAQVVAAESAPRPSQMIELRDLRSRDTVFAGRRVEGTAAVGHHADVVPGKSIRLHGTLDTRTWPVQYDRTFRVGDVAEYDSFNMHYTGKILSIGEKAVTIGEARSNGGRAFVRKHRLSIYTFSWRNRDLDLAAIAARNADVMSSC